MTPLQAAAAVIEVVSEARQNIVHFGLILGQTSIILTKFLGKHTNIVKFK